MGLFDKIIDFSQRINDKTNKISGFNENVDIHEEKLPIFPEWFFTARWGQPRSINLSEVRSFAKSPWVQMVINTIKKEISIIDWDIVNKDEEDDEEYLEQKKELKKRLQNLNTDGESVEDLASAILTDVCEIDSGAWVKVFTRNSYEEREVEVIDDVGNKKGTEMKMVLKPFGQREIAEVRQADGGTFLKQVDIYKRLRAYWQYSFKNPRTNPVFFEPDEVIYFQMNKRTYTLYGFSPVQSIQQVLELLIQSTRWNKDFFKNNAIPEGLISLPGANAESMKKFKEAIEARVKGKSHSLLFQNTDAKFESFMRNSKDMEWLEGQKWYFHLVFGIFGVSPVEAGFHENVNQGNQAGQERVTVKNAIKPYLKIIEDRVNNNLIPELLQQEEVPFKFEYQPKEHVEEQIEFEQAIKEIEIGAMTINEYRRSKGKKVVDWGDEPGAYNPFGGMQDMGMEGKPGRDEQSEDAKKPETEEKSFDIKPGEDIIEESKDYASFMEKTVNKWKQQIVNAIKREIKADKTFEYNKKTFGNFMQALLNTVNTHQFRNTIKRLVKIDLNTSIESVEKDLGINIGFTSNYTDLLNKLSQQQMEGYNIHGKQWAGIKGVVKQTQFKIIKQVEEGLRNGKSTNEIAQSVQKTFEGSSMSQATRIARTETTRFLNEGKLLGYKESGVTGQKMYSAVMDSKTSDLCRRLHNKYHNKGVGLDESFIDPKTNKEFNAPPSHPHCRCTIQFEPDI